MVTFPLVFDGLYVQGGEAEMFGAGFGGAVKFRRKNPLVGPLEDGAVGGGGAVVVVLAGDVEGEVEEGLSAGFKEGGEAVDDRLESASSPEHIISRYWGMEKHTQCYLLFRSH